MARGDAEKVFRIWFRVTFPTGKPAKEIVKAMKVAIKIVEAVGTGRIDKAAGIAATFAVQGIQARNPEKTAAAIIRDLNLVKK